MLKLIAVLCCWVTAGSLFAAPFLSFSNAKFFHVGKTGSGKVRLESESAPQGFSLRWGKQIPRIIEMQLTAPNSPKLEKFDEAEFQLNIALKKAVSFRRIVIRFQDAKGETFQFANKTTGAFSGKMALKYRVADDGSAVNIWGGNKNRKIDWPLRFIGLAIDCNEKTPPDAEILLESLEFRKTGDAAAAPVCRSVPQTQREPQFSAGARPLISFAGAKFAYAGKTGSGKVRLESESAPQGFSLRWGKQVPRIIEMQLTAPNSPRLEKFDEAEFQLNIVLKKEVSFRRIVIRFQDAKGETFQFANKTTGAFSGKMALKYRVADDGSAVNIWGGNKNRKIDWPLRFIGLAIDCNEKTPPDAEILLESLEFRKKGENLEISLETGHPLYLLTDQKKKTAELLIGNRGRDDAVLGGVLHITDAAGKVRKYAVSAEAAAGKTARIPIPGDYSRQDCWKIRYELISATGKRYSGEHRFARMIPAGPTPGRAGNFLFGLCSHPERYGVKKAGLEALAAGLCGAKVMRIDFSWNKIQPGRDKWDFSAYDTLVSLMAAQGVEMQALLGYAAYWAVPRDFKPKNTSSAYVRGGKFADPGLYAAYCEKVASHYRGRIRYFEIWNEPDLTGFANFEFSQYMELLRAGYAAIRKVSPDAVVMNGGIASIYTDARNQAGDNSGWVKVLKADGGKHFDLFAFHGHGPLDSYLTQLDLLEKAGLIGKNALRPWYSNETAETSADIGETEQAAVLFKKLLSAWARGAVGYNWYNLREKGEIYPMGHRERHYGLITVDFEPKPAYLTFNMLAGNYRNSRFAEKLSVPPEITAYRFRDRNGGERIALWSSGHPRNLLAALPPGTVKVDLFGNETPVDSQNGFSCLPVTTVPYTVKIPAWTTEKIHFEQTFLRPSGPVQFSLEPGKVRTVMVPLANPTKKPLNLTLKSFPVGHVSVLPGKTAFLLKPGESCHAEIRLLASPQFAARMTCPVPLRLELLLDGERFEDTSFLLFRKNNADEPLWVLDRYAQYRMLIPSAPGNEPWYWKGPGDLSAKVFFSCEKETIRLKIAVTDDCHVQPYRDGSVWKGDSVQIGLFVPGQSGYWKLGLTRLADGAPAVFCWNRPASFADPSGKIRLATSRNESEKRTVYEVQIPFAALGLTAQTAAKGFYFNLLVNDNDGKFREGFIAAAPGMGISDDPARWIQIIPD